MLGLGVTFRGGQDKLLPALEEWPGLRSFGSFPLLCIPTGIAFLVLFLPLICCLSFCPFSDFCLLFSLFFPFTYKGLLQASQLTLSLMSLHPALSSSGPRLSAVPPRGSAPQLVTRGAFFFLTILRCGGGGSCCTVRNPTRYPIKRLWLGPPGFLPSGGLSLPIRVLFFPPFPPSVSPLPPPPCSLQNSSSFGRNSTLTFS